MRWLWICSWSLPPIALLNLSISRDASVVLIQTHCEYRSFPSQISIARSSCFVFLCALSTFTAAAMAWKNGPFGFGKPPPNGCKGSLSRQYSHKRTADNAHVLLTGSTGNMGAYILHSLLSHPEIKQITCLNRSASASTRQLENNEARGLKASAALLRSQDPRIAFLTVDLTKADLGLSPDQYASLTKTASIILHNAWPVSFNLSFSSFRPSLQGVQNLITLALSCHHLCTFMFISSVSVVGRWGSLPGSTATVPEVELQDWRTAKMGYGQSKLVAERVCVKAAEDLGLTTNIVRVGQVAGPVERELKGEWSRWEWLPSLIKSSASLGVVPETLGPMEDVDWVPVDVLGTVIGELVMAAVGDQANDDRIGLNTPPQDPTWAQKHLLGRKRETNKNQPNQAVGGLATFYHTANPHCTSYSDTLLPVITRHLEASTGKPLKGVSFTAWVDALAKSTKQVSRAADTTNAEDNPAAKLITFFRELQDKAVRFPDARSAKLESRETAKVSESLRDCEAIGEEWMRLWMRQWGY